jgi:hypothetical protein
VAKGCGNCGLGRENLAGKTSLFIITAKVVASSYIIHARAAATLTAHFVGKNAWTRKGNTNCASDTQIRKSKTVL